VSLDRIGTPVLPWSALISVGEVKCQNQRTSDQTQAEDYLRALFTYRTDLITVYGLLWQPRRLALLQGTASGIVSLQESTWQGSAWKRILYSYITRLYHLGHQRDHSLSYSAENEAWSVKVADTAYRMSPFYTSISPRRISTVFFGWKEDDPEQKPLILKRSLLPSDTRFFEGILFQLAHGANTIPGLARLEDHEHVPFPPGSDRVKTCLVWSSVGVPLSQCPSVFALLKVFFDLVVSE